MPISRSRLFQLIGLGVILLLGMIGTEHRLGAQCVNPVVCENALTGNPESEWDISGAGDESLQGFATDISGKPGDIMRFKVDTSAPTFSINIYRIGYYGGMGARKVATISPVTGTNQPACLTVSATGLIDCGNWSQSATWTIPSTAVSGVYIARLSRSDTGGASHILFVVRDDTGNSQLLFQASDTTWQAYNDYGGNSLYVGSPAGRAYKVSYNRPLNTRGNQYGRANFFGGEYPMVRWLEANGYSVSYTTDTDTDRRGSLILQHKVFLSVGHDEYWSAAQRTNVEAARAAGIHLAFFSGDEMFWKVRRENSIDGTNTAYRTLVSYKETHDNAKTDPLDPPTWTGTWRDPRFSPPADGGRPENALTGTIFTVNCCAQQPITVSGAVKGFRFWRNTLVASLGASQTVALAPGVVGYEFDEDLDNGFRPAGLIRLSAGTYSVVSKLQDYGSTYAAGTATHSLTLYRHSSGALVFGAGTIRYSWALDVDHDADGNTPDVPTSPDVTIRQATVNLFADMGVQPATLQPGLVASPASTDSVAPVSTITSPLAGTNFASGTPVTISGTATDAGGVVAGVEVSADSGATWHPATGTLNWTYAWTPGVSGSIGLMSRATDDSGNKEVAPKTVTVTVGSVLCPCSIWSATTTPALTATGDSKAVELGVRFRADGNGTITGIRFYKASTNTGTHVGSLWSNTGTLLGQATFSGETSSGWQQVTFATPVAVTANTTYVASYHANGGNYSYNSAYFATTGVDNAPLHALTNGLDGSNGVYLYSANAAFPTQTYNSNNYWVDVLYVPPADSTAPTVTARTPASGATSVPLNTTVTATFSEAINPATLTTTTFVLKNPSNVTVAATVTYNGATNTATLTPNAALTKNVVYTATLTGGASGIKDPAGNALAANVVWSFTTINDTTAPTVTSTVPASGATGVSTSATVNATFSEAINTSTLTTTTFVLRNPSNVAVAATVTYNGATNTATLTPSAALAGGTTYTATIVGGSSGVKDLAANALASNKVWSFTTLGADATPPTVAGTAPAASASGVSPSATVNATFSEPLNASTVTAATFVLRDPANVVVPAVIAYVAATNTATLTPSAALAASTIYTATITGGASGVKDLAGNAMAANYVWSFTIAAPATPLSIWTASATPANASGGDPNSVELGVRFRSDIPGTISGIRFYKGSTNTGTHTGTLWTNTGTQLATATFTNETASGWQQVNFSTPIAITANTTYVASYHAPLGNYSYNSAYFAAAGVDSPPLHALASGVDGSNGIYIYSAATTFPSQTFNSNNYWVDVVFNALTDTTPPTVTAVTPTDGSTGVSSSTTVTATFSEGIDTATLTAGTFVLRDPSNVAVPATLIYAPGTNVATLTPTAALAQGALYTATISGGAGGVKDTAGNALASNVVWSFTTADTTAPTVVSTNPASGATGVSTATTVTATFSENVNAATLTTATFVLKNPANVTVTATVTYNATTFVATLAPSAPLSASTVYTATITGGASGVKDPAGNALASNKVWSFTTGGSDTTPPTVTAMTPPSGATGVAAGTTVTATFNEPIDAATLSGATFVLRDPANILVPASVTYTAGTNTANLAPSQALAGGVTYTATVVGPGGIRDLAGNALAANAVWSFTTAAPAGSAFTIWDDSAVPAQIMTSDPNPGDFGVRFRSDFAGTITGVRFYKGLTNTGTHIGSLWSNTGTLLATAIFSNETASGWQQVDFAAPVAIAANTTYVASYHTNVGNYGTTNGYFATTFDHGPLHALADGLDGANGVYVYGFTAFPTQTFNSANYWVDVVFAPADSTPPAVTAVSPASGATSVPASTTVTATFSETIKATTINVSTFVLRDPSSLVVAASIAYDSVTGVATLTPSVPLSSFTTYTATISGGSSGVTDLVGNPLAVNVVWSFTTLDTTPPVVTTTTPAAGATGVSGTTTVTATFSKAINASTLTTSTFTLVNPSNVAVAASISYNSATKTATLTPSQTLLASTTYTARVVGGASGVKDTIGNALAVDFVWSFTTQADTTPPTVTATLPASGATGASRTAPITATFSEAMNASTITGSTFVLRDSSNATVAATVSYNANVATLTLSAPLAASSVYTATISGGAGGVTDVAGNALAVNKVWSFTTVAPVTAGNTTIGANLDSGDSGFLNGSFITTGAAASTATASVYVGPIDTSTTNRSYQIAIYTDSGGKPGTLVASSTTGTLVANAWNTVPISASLLASTKYWLVYASNGRTSTVNNMFYDAAGANTGAYTTTTVTFGTFPATFPATNALANAQFSLYITFAP